jgi:hypothetical protein
MIKKKAEELTEEERIEIINKYINFVEQEKEKRKKDRQLGKRDQLIILISVLSITILSLILNAIGWL